MRSSDGAAADPAFATSIRQPTRVVSLTGPEMRDQDREIAAETAAAIVYGGVPFAVMMLTPGDLVDFAYGFSLTEGVAGERADIRAVAIEEDELGLRLLVDIAPDRLHQHLARRRAMSGRTGCGVCGIDDLNALKRGISRAGPGAAAPSVPAIRRALAEIEEHQTLNRRTGAVHAAGFAALDGAIRLVREDVGRHNALDKLIGACLRSEMDAAAGFVVITSRCSFEMVEKTAVFGAPTLVAISAPTSLALERARALGITLIGIARRDTMTVFCGAEHFGRDGGDVAADEAADARATAPSQHA